MEEKAGPADETTGYLPFHAMPVVGLGGSAGSLAPLRAFFANVRPDSGLVYVVIVHLSPEHESMLAEILQNSAPIPVTQVRTSVKIEPNHVYVIPPGHHMLMADGHLELAPLDHERGRRVAVDYFFRTLADTHGPTSVAVVLSGADADGAIGIKRIKERGGLTIAQEPDESEHRGMPQAAIATGLVDWVMRAAEMPARIDEYRRNGQRVQMPLAADLPLAPPPEAAPSESGLRDVLSVLRARTGRDFSNYKRGTIIRRLSRRLQVHGLEQLQEYHAFLRTHPGETHALLQDLLISVTNFFRDREAFETLERAIPQFFKDKGPKDVIRIWVPGCATGEEAYSIAILLHEHAARLEAPPGLQIFATDLDEVAIASARTALYPDTIMADVSEDRLRRFFTRQTGGYRVAMSVRETVLFAAHDVLKDPPFSRLDLISCRNLLIYLSREAQSRTFERFHFALRGDGRLFLGTSESADERSDLFAPEHKKYRLYSRLPAPRSGLPVPLNSAVPHVVRLHPLVLPPDIVPPEPAAATAAGRPAAMSELHFKLVEHFAPPSVVVNADNQIAHLSPRVGRFLKFVGGEPTADLLSVVHPMLRLELRAALFSARENQVTVEVSGIPVDFETGARQVDVSVHPAPTLSPGFLLVTFAERDAADAAAALELATETEGIVRSLERELEYTKSLLRNSQEQHGASSEEMKASNEELQAMNEELRSATEELETSREELQSVNEELVTVNQDLKSKVDELARSNGDLQNLMAATNIATIFLDRELRVKRYTPSAVTLFSLISTDVGRPLFDLRHRLEFDTVISDAEAVLQSSRSIEREMRGANGRWYLASVIPYLGTDQHVVGVVLTFVDISRRKQAEDDLLLSKQELEGRVLARTSELHGSNEQLQKEMERRRKMEAERETMMQALVTAQEAERERISRELHDEIGQHVTALLLGLKEIQAPVQGHAPAAARLQAMQEITERIGQQIHDVAVELRPTSLRDLGLVRCLANFIEERMVRANIAADFDYEELGTGRLPEPVETALFRILCEALHNVFRHAQATRVAVILRRRPGRVVAIVEDNGTGFDLAMEEKAPRRAHLGIVGMRERVALLGGELALESRPGEGTTVIVRLPLPEGNGHG